jgi:hypothetical protein
MLPELAETQAHGEIARIYAEVRELCSVPYVSSLHRHLATRPGWLEWCWSAVRPAFVSGQAQRAAWAAAADVQVAPLPPRPPAGEHGAVLEVMTRYRKTSPEMVLFGTLLRDALPSVTACPARPAPRGPRSPRSASRRRTRGA